MCAVQLSHNIIVYLVLEQIVKNNAKENYGAVYIFHLKSNSLKLDQCKTAGISDLRRCSNKTYEPRNTLLDEVKQIFR